MNFLSAIPFRTFNIATLRLAAFLVPDRQRAEWLKEWKSELWHIRETLNAEPEIDWQAEQEAAAFCRGAFADAFCLRQNRTRILPGQHLASAARCVLFLGSLAAATYCIALLLPGARAATQPSPYHNARNVMLITNARYTGRSIPIPTIRADQFRSWQAQDQHLFRAFAFYRPVVKYVTVAPHDSAELSVARSSPNLFALLGLPVDLASDRNANSGIPGIIITDRVWRRYFGQDPHVSGRIITVGLRKAEVVGVLPAHLWTLPGHIDAWLVEPDKELMAIPANLRGFLVGQLEPSPEHAHFSDHWKLTAPSSSGSDADFICDSLSSRSQEPFSIFLFTVILAFLALPATTSLPLGEYPTTHHKLTRSTKFRRWAFLAVKSVMVLPIIYFGSIDLAYFSTSIDPTTSQYIQLGVSFCACLFALRWSLKDQRQRCPVCLGKLTNPARVGHPSRTFLAWNGTELICVGGHGLLHVPEMPTSWFSTQRWLYLDPSWEVLFPESHIVSPSIS